MEYCKYNKATIRKHHGARGVKAAEDFRGVLEHMRTLSHGLLCRVVAFPAGKVVVQTRYTSGDVWTRVYLDEDGGKITECYHICGSGENPPMSAGMFAALHQCAEVAEDYGSTLVAEFTFLAGKLFRLKLGECYYEL